MSEIDEFILSFDLGFSDIYPDESVRFMTFRRKMKELGLFKKIINADSIINSFLSFDTQHPQAQLWLESQTDLMASLYLILGGYYRQGFICVRTWFEITLLGIYYSKYYKGNNSRYDQWKRGVRRSPNWKNLLKSLFSRPEFEIADKKIKLKSKLEEFYTELSAFVHNRGMLKYDLQKGRDNVPRFVDHAFDLYLDMVLRTFNMIALALYTCYREDLPQLSSKEFTELEPLLTEETKKYVTEHA